MSERRTRVTLAGARDLANRLRGRYAKGPLQPSGVPEFGWAVFTALPSGEPFPAIYEEAAVAIEALIGALIALAEADQSRTPQTASQVPGIPPSSNQDSI